MTYKPIIYPYKLHSHAGKVLAKALDTKKVRPDGKYKYKQNHIIINWGNSITPQWEIDSPLSVLWINQPNLVQAAINKLYTLGEFTDAQVSIPEWTCSFDQVKQWILEENCIVVGRRVLNGHSGQGIEILDPTDSWNPGEYTASFDDLDSFYGCKFYTKYFKRKYELRAHVVNHKVIDIQVKRKKKGGNADTKIRCHKTGWVYCREELPELPQHLYDTAVKAVDALGLTFGAVDLAYNQKKDRAVVFEVNTAPGLVGSTIDIYANAITEYIEELP